MKYLKLLVYVVIAFAALGIGSFIVFSTQELAKPDPGPTHTPRPGFQTLVYEGVNDGKATLGVPTDTPGVALETQVQNAVDGSLTPASTLTATASRTPTGTPLPTRTSVPGIQTVVYGEVNQVLEADAQPTLEPGPSNEELVATAVEKTLVALTPTTTFTLTPTSLPSETARP